MQLKPIEYLEVATPEEARAMGLPWGRQPVGALLCQGRDGSRVTKITLDIEYHRMLVLAAQSGGAGGLTIDASKYPLARDGWPGDHGWA